MAARFVRVTANFPVLFTCAVDECILCQFEIEYFLHSNIHFPHSFFRSSCYISVVCGCRLLPFFQSHREVNASKRFVSFFFLSCHFNFMKPLSSCVQFCAINAFKLIIPRSGESGTVIGAAERTKIKNSAVDDVVRCHWATKDAIDWDVKCRCSCCSPFVRTSKMKRAETIHRSYGYSRKSLM